MDAAYYLFVGVNSMLKDGGIYSCCFNALQNKINGMNQQDSFPGLSYVVMHPTLKYLFASGCSNDGKGEIRSYAIDRIEGRLDLIDSFVFDEGTFSHIQTDRSGKFLFASAYHAGQVLLLGIGTDGKFSGLLDTVFLKGSSVNRERQDAAHPHSTYVSPDNRFAVLSDLGSDRVILCRLDEEKGKLGRTFEWTARPGMGPRHFAFHPNGLFAYLLTELSSEIVCFRFNAENGILSERQILPALQPGYTGENLSADLLVSRDGNSLYATNRGGNSIAQFVINADTGELTPAGYSPTAGWARAIHLTSDGKYLLTLDEEFADSKGGLEGFAVNPDTGKLEPLGFWFPLPHAYNFSQCSSEKAHF